MNRRILIFTGLVWLGLLTFIGFKVRTVAEHRDQQAALHAKQLQLETDLAVLRREHTALAVDLKQAEQQLATMPTPRSPASNLRPEQRDEIDRWLVRIRKLRKIFAENPEQRVPEMQFLKDDDWLRVAKTFPTETDDEVRAAVAAVRSRAVGYFADQISVALRKYNAATKSERPASIQALVPYFDATVDSTMLERFEIINRPSNFGGNASASTWVVTNKAPIDPDYDTRYSLTGSSMMSGSGLLKWMPELADRYQAAGTKFRRANPGQAASIDAFLPYFDPPLERDLADRLRKAERRP